MNTNETVELFLTAVRGEVAPATHAGYTHALKQLESIYPLPLADVTLNDLRRVRGQLMDHYAPASVNTFLRVWKLLFNWSIDEGLIEASPAVRLRPLKAPRQPKVADLADVLLMIDEAKRTRHLRDAAIMLLLLTTGCRVGAVKRLKVADIDHEARTANLIEKGNKRHTVHLIDETYQAIGNYMEFERPAGLANPFLFVSAITPENQLSASNAILYMLRRHAAAVGVTSPVNPHSFRHLFCVTMLKNGAALDQVSKLLGHSAVAITERYYAAWNDDMLQDVHERLNPLRGVAI